MPKGPSGCLSFGSPRALISEGRNTRKASVTKLIRPILARWFTFFDSNAENRKTRWSKTFVLLVMLMVEKKAPPHFLLAISLQLSPEQLAHMEPGANQAEAPRAEHPQKASEEKKERQMYSNCQAAVLALTREKNLLAMDLIYWFILPFRNAHTELTQALHQGPGAVRKWYTKTALGSHFHTLQGVLRTKGKTEALHDLGFILEAHFQAEEECLPEDPLVLEQDALAKQADRLILHLLSEHSREGATHSFHPIFAAAGLFSTVQSEVNSRLQHLSKIYSAWQAALKYPSPSLQKLLARSPLACILEQEILMGLATANFQEIPGVILGTLDHLFSSLGSSLICELGFQQWEGRERRGFVLEIICYWGVLRNLPRWFRV